MRASKATDAIAPDVFRPPGALLRERFARGFFCLPLETRAQRDRQDRRRVEAAAIVKSGSADTPSAIPSSINLRVDDAHSSC